jgi:DNA (cytosine-5)-methyltransferase 1
MSKKSMPTRSLIDLFAGCGGLSLGLEQAGFTSVHVNELNGDALSTYIENRDHVVAGEPFSSLRNNLLRSNDIDELLQSGHLETLVSFLRNCDEVDVRPEDGGNSIDLITGGPPCQGFSLIGYRRSYETDRRDLAANQLYEKMAEVITRVRPRLFLFENVTGIRSAKWTMNGEGSVWDDVFERFRSIPGYKVRASSVRARDYGVAQNRPRILIVGVRADVADALKGRSYKDGNTREEVGIDLEGCGETPEAARDAVSCGFLPGPAVRPTYPDLSELLGDLVDDAVPGVLKSGDYPSDGFRTDRYPARVLTKTQRGLRTKRNGQLLSKGSVLLEQDYSRHSRRVIERFSQMIKCRGEIPNDMKTKKFAQRWLPPKWDNRGPFITVTSLPDDYVHFEQPRILTVREWARLQFFPDWYKFSGQRTTGGLRRAGNPRDGLFDRELPKYTQIGNAVPVKLAEAVGRHFSNMLLAASM